MKKKLMIFCIAVGLSLTLAAPSSAAVTLNVDPASLSDGIHTDAVISTFFGDIKFTGEIRNNGDPDLPSGKVFDVVAKNTPATLTFDFDPKYAVTSVTFSYGGNQDKITVEAYDNSSTPVLLDSLVNAPTGNGASTGPVTLEAGFGNSIYTLSWIDPGGSNSQILYDLASLQGVTLEVIPAPGAILLGSIGVGVVGWLRRRRTL